MRTTTTVYCSPIEDRVDAGIAWLDATVPGWRERIDLATLQLHSSFRCVLGQVFADVAVGGNGYSHFRSAYPDFTFNDVIAHGFEVHDEDYDELTDAWLDALDPTR